MQGNGHSPAEEALAAYGLVPVEEDVGEYGASALEEVFGEEDGVLFEDEGDDFFFDDEQDDDLLEALDEALDEFEEEQNREAIKELAAPEFDISEIEAPNPVVAYRGALEHFLARERDLPRPDQAKRRRPPAMDVGLTELLAENFDKARNSIERRRAKVWVCSAGSSVER